MNNEQNRQFSAILGKVQRELGSEIAKQLRAKLRPAIQDAPPDIAEVIRHVAHEVIDAVPISALPSLPVLISFLAGVQHG